MNLLRFVQYAPKLFLHVLGTPQESDVCVHTEDDQLYWMGMIKTADDKFLLYGADSKVGLRGGGTEREDNTTAAALNSHLLFS